MTDETVLHRVRGLSRPFLILLTIALIALVMVQGGEILAVLFFRSDGGWHAAVRSSADGIGLSIFANPDRSRDVLLESLSFWQRSALALLAGLCATTGGLALFHLRQLFSLYSRGEVFAEASIRNLKRFGLWLALSGVMVNVADHLFPLVTGHPAYSFANAPMTLVYGGMTYVVARVMELGRQADQERREFI